MSVLINMIQSVKRYAFYFISWFQFLFCWNTTFGWLPSEDQIFFFYSYFQWKHHSNYFTLQTEKNTKLFHELIENNERKWEFVWYTHSQSKSIMNIKMKDALSKTANITLNKQTITLHNVFCRIYEKYFSHNWE